MIEVAAAVIFRDGKVLLTSRPEDKPPAGWEFPGGKLEPGESVADAARRELFEELSMHVTPQDIMYSLDAGNLKLHFIRCHAAENEQPEPRENQQFRWIALSKNVPEGLLENDLFFWNFLASEK